MPIDPIHLQRRHAEQGRIRLGHKVQGGRPAKLESFRFTSPNRSLIEALAELYGGTPEAWDNAGIPEHQVLSDSTSVPIIVVTNGVSQWFEHWTAAGIGHRCDGTRDAKTNQLCSPDDPAHQAAIEKPTTRLSVMLPELDSTGVWRMETHGWNAAAEIPMVGELAAHVGSMVPARLLLVERRKVIQVKGKPTTSRFVVPMVDLEINIRDLAQIVSGGAAPQLEAAPRQEIAAAPAASPLDLWQEKITACTTVEEVSTLWREIVAAGQLFPDVRSALEDQGRVLSVPATPPSREEPASVTEEGPAGDIQDADIVEEDPPADAEEVVLTDPLEDDRAWQDLVTALGRTGATTTEIVTAYQEWAGHTVDQGTAATYRRFIQERA